MQLNVFHAFCLFLFKPFAVPRTHTHACTHIVCAPGLTSFDFSLLLSHIISVLASCLSLGDDLCLTLTYEKPAVDRSQLHTIPLPLRVCLIYIASHSLVFLSLSLSDALHPRYTKIARAADVSRYGGYCNPWKHHVSLPLEISSAFIIFIYVLRQILHKLCHGESARIYMCLLSLVWA